MAYDVELADRLRELLAGEPDVTEKQMFGGLAFLIAGHMAVCAGSGGDMLLRVDPEQTDALVEDPRARRYVMRSREMNGWLGVQTDASLSDDQLGRWVDLGVAFVRTLPPK